ncbi:MAG: BrnT family toxin [Alphaproteobacteria bacterium]|nr:BrnT family toxin [Alphaproteobacteria bacterium]
MATFEWDPAKARSNLAKHGVAFDDARLVWEDPLHVVYPDRVVDGEQRWHAVGVLGLVTVLLVVHIYVGDIDTERVRIVSARKATPWERKIYEQDNA